MEKENIEERNQEVEFYKDNIDFLNAITSEENKEKLPIEDSEIAEKMESIIDDIKDNGNSDEISTIAVEKDESGNDTDYIDIVKYGEKYV